MIRKLLISLAVLGMASQPVRGDSLKPSYQPPKMPRNESGDRVVDGAALKAIEVAVQRLLRVTTSQKGGVQEPVLMLRLAETQQRAAAIRFRVERGKVKSPVYRAKYQESLATIDQILARFPQHQVVPRAVFLRGVSLQELDRKEDALASFETVVTRYPKSTDRLAAALYGYDIAAEKNDYARGIRLLTQAGAGTKPGSSAYALLVERLSWSYYATGDFDQALKYLGYWAASSKEKELDRVRKNAALFLAAGLELHPEKYGVQQAYQYFRSLKLPPQQMGDVAVQYAFLIRAKQRDAELEQWVFLPGFQTLDPGYRLDLYGVHLGNQLNRKVFAQLDKTLDAIRGILASGFDAEKGGERVVRLAREVSEAVAVLQASSEPYVGPLMKCYRLLIALSKRLEGDSPAASEDRMAKLYFNLSETAFKAKEYEIATSGYRYLLENYGKHPLAAGAQLKSLAARFEALRSAGAIRRDLDVLPRAKAQPGQLDPRAAQWIQWVDLALEGGVPATAKADMDIYRFESVRMIYASGKIDDALGRAAHLVAQTPASVQAPAAWALYQDTLIAGNEWQAGYDGAKKLLKEARGPIPEKLRNRIATFAEQCSFKRIEGLYVAKQEKEALEAVETYLAEFPNATHREDALKLAANAALAGKNKTLALRYYMLGNQTTRGDPRIMLIEASVAEDTFEFATAARRYAKFLALPERQIAAAGGAADYADRALRLAWVSGDRRVLLREIIPAKGICGEGQRVKRALAQDCEFFKQLAKAGSAPDDKTPGKAVFAFLANRGIARLGPSERLREIRQVTAAWNALNEERKVFTLPLLLKRLPALAMGLPNVIRAKSPINRKSLQGLPLRGQWITELEKFAGVPASMPSIQFGAAYELALAEVYRDFATDMRGIMALPGLEGEALQQHQAMVQGAIDATEAKAKAVLERVVARAREGGLEGDLPGRIEMIAQAGIPPFSGLPDAQPWVQALPLPEEGQAMGRAFALAVEKQNWDAFAWLLRDLKARNWVYTQWVEAGEALWLSRTLRYPEGRARLAVVQPQLPRDLSRFYAQFVPEVNRAPSSQGAPVEEKKQ